MMRRVLERGDEAELADVAIQSLGARADLVSEAGVVYGYRDGIYEAIDNLAIERRIKKLAGSPIGNGSRTLRVQSSTTRGALRLAHIELAEPGFFDEAVPGVAFRDLFVRVAADGLTSEPLAREHRARHRYQFPMRAERGHCGSYGSWTMSRWQSRRERQGAVVPRVLRSCDRADRYQVPTCPAALRARRERQDHRHRYLFERLCRWAPW